MITRAAERSPAVVCGELDREPDLRARRFEWAVIDSRSAGTPESERERGTDTVLAGSSRTLEAQMTLAVLVLSAVALGSTPDWLDHYLAGSRALEQRDHAAARAELDAALKLLPRHAATAYQLACAHAVAGQRDAALDWLARSIAYGFTDAALARWDADLASVRDDPRFAALLAPLAQSAAAPPPAPVVITQLGSIVAQTSADEAIVVAGRGWRSGAWDARTHELIAAFERPGEDSSWIACSPDARLVVVTGELEPSNAAYVRIHDAATGDLLRELPDAAAWQTRAQFSLDSRRLFLVGSAPDGDATVWDTQTWSLLSRVPATEFEQAVCSPHAKSIVLVQRGSNDLSNVSVWNVDAQRSVARHADRFSIPYLSVAFADDDSRIAIFDRAHSAVVLLDGSSGAILHELEQQGEAPTAALEFSPDASQLYVARGTKVEIWNTRTGAHERDLEIPSDEERSSALGASVDALLVSGFGTEITLVDVASGRARWTRREEVANAWACTWTPERGHVLVSHDDDVALLDAHDGSTLQTFAGPHIATAIASRPGSAVVWLGARDGSLREVDRATGRTRRTTAAGRARILALALSPAGKRLAAFCADDTLRIIDTESARVTAQVATVTNAARGWSGEGLEFSANGAVCALEDSERAVHLFDATTWQRRVTLAGGDDGVRAFALSNDGARVASSDHDGNVTLRSLSKGEVVPPALHVDGNADTLAFEPGDARLWVGTDRSSVAIFDARTGALVRSLDHADLDGFDVVEIGSIAFDGTAERAAVASSGMGGVAAWEVQSGTRLWSFSYDGGNPAPLRTFFSRDGKRLFVWGQTQWTPRVVDVATGGVVLDLHGRGVGSFVAGGDEHLTVAWSTRGTEFIDVDSGVTRLARIECADDGWVLQGASGHVDGSRAALAAAHVQLAERSYALDGLAAAFVDVKKVAAAAAGVIVSAAAPLDVPALAWTTPHARVVKLATDAKELELVAEATSPSGILAFEVRVDGVRTRVDATPDPKDANRARWTTKLARPPAGKAVELRVRAIATSGVMSRPLRIAIEALP